MVPGSQTYVQNPHFWCEGCGKDLGTHKQRHYRVGAGRRELWKVGGKELCWHCYLLQADHRPIPTDTYRLQDGLYVVKTGRRGITVKWLPF